MKYPKILIVGQYCTTRSGGGIIITNLFKGWNKENIAIAAANIDNPNFEVCDKYYQLGTLEIKRRFPFNLNRWKKPIKSGIIHEKETSTTSPFYTNIQNSALKRIYLRLLHFTGLYHYKYKYKISKEFINWIKEYSPDFIYSQLASVQLIELVSDLRKTLKLPLAIHIMDDWPVTISEMGLFQSYWHKTIDKKLRRLLSDSKVLLSISEAMSKEYMTRYGYNFIPFHNPIDIKFWSLSSKTNYEFNDCFTILYAGRIGIGIQNCFFDIAEAIRCLILKGLKIEFHIQSTNFNPVLDGLIKFDFVKLNTSVPYTELPEIFSKYDLLLLPNDFESKSITYLRYSMPTKASEYMVSGSPILLYSSIETAVTLHALKYHWAYVVCEKNQGKLERAILELYEKKELRIKLANTAKDYAINHFDDIKIREKFKNSFV